MKPLIWMSAALVAALGFFVSWKKWVFAGPTQTSAPAVARSAATSHVLPARVGSGEIPSRDTQYVVADLLPALGPLPQDWRGYTPESITVAIEPDLPLTFDRVRVQHNPDETTTWIGRNTLPGAGLVVVSTREGCDAVLALPTHSYDIHVRGSLAQITLQPNEVECGTRTAGVLAPPIASATPPKFAADARPLASYEETRGADQSNAMPGSLAQIARPKVSGGTAAELHVANLAVFYDASAEQEALGGHIAGFGDAPEGERVLSMPLEQVPTYMNAHYRAYVEAANLVLEQSGVDNLRWNFCGAYRIPDYPAAPTLAEELSLFMGAGVNPGRFAFLKGNELALDQHVLVVGARPDYSGLASFTGRHVAAHIASGYLTLAHELGHNFGITHDRETDHISEDYVSYNHGYVFNYSYVVPVVDPTSDGRPVDLPITSLVGDLMSYATIRLPYFSNPDIAVTGTSILQQPWWTDPTLYALGVPAGNMRGADAARTLREGASAKAAFRTPAQPVVRPVIVTPVPSAVSPEAGRPLSLAVTATGATSFQWFKDGIPIGQAVSASYQLERASPWDAGLYEATVLNTAADVTTGPTIVGISTTERMVGDGRVVGTDIRHPNGNIFDQVLLTGVAEAITADPGQIVRTSFLDTNGDIVQVQFAGAGTLCLALEDSMPPALAANYNQPGAMYVAGHARIIIVDADESTNVMVFSVGRSTAVDQSLFRPETTYDGVADIALVAIASRNGRFGGLRASNSRFTATHGYTGIYAPGVVFEGPVYIGDIHASNYAQPCLVLGSASDVRVTGGDLFQPNRRPVKVAGFDSLSFASGTDSHGFYSSAKKNRARLSSNGRDVTDELVADP